MSRSSGKVAGEEPDDALDLIVAPYIDRAVLLDVLASIEGGFSMVERVTASSSDSRNRTTAVNGEAGASGVLSLLKLNLKASRSAGASTTSGETQETDRYHTFGSMLHRLRNLLGDEGLVKSYAGGGVGWDDLQPSDFVELRGVFRPNPLSQSIATVLRLLSIFRITITVPDKPQGNVSRDQKDRINAERQAAQDQLKELEQIEQLLLGVASDIEQDGSKLFIVELAGERDEKAVVRLFDEYVRDPTFAELAHGEFRLLGKLVRNLGPGDDERIDLLEGSGMAGLGDEALESLLGGFRDAGSGGLKLPDIETSLGAPALQVVPIAVYV